MIINTNAITPAKAIDTILELWDLGASFMLWGKPGVGKNGVAEGTAARKPARLHTENLNTKIASDLLGLPYPDIASGTTTYLQPEFLPVDDEPSILLLDELTTADEQTRTAAYGLILERRVGKYRLPEQCRIIAASNREEDGAVSASLGSALYDRMIHLVIEPDMTSWLRWAVGNGIHPTVMGFVRAQPHLLCATAEQLAGENALLPSPRSWERISRILRKTQEKSGGSIGSTARIAIQGTIGIENAATFFALAEQIIQLPSIDTLLAETKTDAIRRMLPTNIDVLYALGYTLAAALAPGTLEAVFRVINVLADAQDIPSNAEVAALAGSLCSQRAIDMKLGRKLGACAEFQAYNERFVATPDEHQQAA
jgi:hypothetical protein